MPDLVSNGRAHRLTGRGIHPEGTNHIVVARTSGEPLRLIEQVYLHLILVEIALALSCDHHTQFGDIGLIELLGLLQQVIHIDPQLFRYTAGIGITAKTFLPEYEEVLALL